MRKANPLLTALRAINVGTLKYGSGLPTVLSGSKMCEECAPIVGNALFREDVDPVEAIVLLFTGGRLTVSKCLRRKSCTVLVAWKSPFKSFADMLGCTELSLSINLKFSISIACSFIIFSTW